MKRLKREQTVPTTLERAWEFIRTPSNLNLITPDDLQFTICSDVPEEMYDGLLIDYRIRIPVVGTTRWVTEIKHIRPFHSFVDEQRIGPYSFWYHYHELTEVDGGIRCVDEVSYALPWGPAGRLAHALFVKSTLKRIFDYRAEKMAELLSRKP